MPVTPEGSLNIAELADPSNAALPATLVVPRQTEYPVAQMTIGFVARRVP